ATPRRRASGRYGMAPNISASAKAFSPAPRLPPAATAVSAGAFRAFSQQCNAVSQRVPWRPLRFSPRPLRSSLHHTICEIAIEVIQDECTQFLPLEVVILTLSGVEGEGPLYFVFVLSNSGVVQLL